MARMVGQKSVELGWLYDFTILPAGAVQNQVILFQTPVGQIMPGTAIPKSQRMTNMRLGGFLGSIKTFTISGLYIQPLPFLVSDDVDNLIDGYGAVWINEKIYPDYFTLNMFMGGPSWRESVRGPGAGPDFRAFPGDATINNMITYKRPFLVTIEHIENFRLEITWPNGFTPTEMMYIGVVCFGRVERAVQ